MEIGWRERGEVQDLEVMRERGRKRKGKEKGKIEGEGEGRGEGSEGGYEGDIVRGTEIDGVDRKSSDIK